LRVKSSLNKTIKMAKKVAVVTGSNKGVGLALSELFARTLMEMFF